MSLSMTIQTREIPPTMSAGWEKLGSSLSTQIADLHASTTSSGCGPDTTLEPSKRSNTFIIGQECLYNVYSTLHIDPSLYSQQETSGREFLGRYYTHLHRREHFLDPVTSLPKSIAFPFWAARHEAEVVRAQELEPHLLSPLFGLACRTI